MRSPCRDRPGACSCPRSGWSRRRLSSLPRLPLSKCAHEPQAIRPHGADLDVGLPAAVVKPGHGEADGGASYGGDGDVGWEMMAGCHALDRHAAGNESADDPGPHLLAIAFANGERRYRKTGGHGGDMASVEGEIALARVGHGRVAGIAAGARARRDEVGRVLYRGANGQGLDIHHDVLAQGTAKSEIEEIDQGERKENAIDRDIGGDACGLAVVSHGPPIEAIDARRIAGTAFSRQLVLE